MDPCFAWRSHARANGMEAPGPVRPVARPALAVGRPERLGSAGPRDARRRRLSRPAGRRKAGAGEDSGDLPQGPRRLVGRRDGAGAGGADRARVGRGVGRRRGHPQGAPQGGAGGHPPGRRRRPRGAGAHRRAPPRSLLAPPEAGVPRPRAGHDPHPHHGAGPGRPLSRPVRVGGGVAGLQPAAHQPGRAAATVGPAAPGGGDVSAGHRAGRQERRRRAGPGHDLREEHPDRECRQAPAPRPRDRAG